MSSSWKVKNFPVSQILEKQEKVEWKEGWITLQNMSLFPLNNEEVSEIMIWIYQM